MEEYHRFHYFTSEIEIANIFLLFSTKSYGLVKKSYELKLISWAEHWQFKTEVLGSTPSLDALSVSWKHFNLYSRHNLEKHYYYYCYFYYFSLNFLLYSTITENILTKKFLFKLKILYNGSKKRRNSPFSFEVTRKVNNKGGNKSKFLNF